MKSRKLIKFQFCRSTSEVFFFLNRTFEIKKIQLRKLRPLKNWKARFYLDYLKYSRFKYPELHNKIRPIECLIIWEHGHWKFRRLEIVRSKICEKFKFSLFRRWVINQMKRRKGRNFWKIVSIPILRRFSFISSKLGMGRKITPHLKINYTFDGNCQLPL